MSDPSFAAALLARARTSAVVDGLLPSCDTTRTAVTLGTLPSPTVAHQLAAGTVGQALTVAHDQRADPLLLRFLARDDRKTVRRAVAANPSTPQDALAALEDWAMEAKDQETLDNLFGTRDLTTYLERRVDQCWPEVTITPVGQQPQLAPLQASVAGRNAAANLARLPAAAAHDLLPRLPHPVRFHLGALCARGQTPYLSPEDLLTSGDQDAALVTAAGAWSTDDPLPDPFVDVVVHAWPAIAAGIATAQYALNHWAGVAFLLPTPTFTAAAAARLAASGHPDLLDVLTRSALEGRAGPVQPLVPALCANPSPAAAALLVVGQDLAHLDDAQYRRCCERLRPSDKDAVRAALDGPRPLDGAPLAAILAGGNVEMTLRWLTGRTTHPVSGDRFLTLCATPGTALRMSGHQYDRRPEPPVDPADAVVRLIRHGLPTPPPNALLEVGWVLVQAAAREARATEDRPLPGWVLDQLVAALPDRPEAWQLLLEVAGQVRTGTIEQVAAAISAASG